MCSEPITATQPAAFMTLGRSFKDLWHDLICVMRHFEAEWVRTWSRGVLSILWHMSPQWAHGSSYVPIHVSIFTLDTGSATVISVSPSCLFLDSILWRWYHLFLCPSACCSRDTQKMSVNEWMNEWDSTTWNFQHLHILNNLMHQCENPSTLWL
jgi:hypothetical protein